MDEETWRPVYSTCPPECACTHPTREHSRTVGPVLGVLTGQVPITVVDKRPCAAGTTDGRSCASTIGHEGPHKYV